MDKLKRKLPDKPGVYMFKKGRSILYVGKATSLRDRVRSYFSKDLMETRGPKLVEMLEKATSVACEETDSVLEALVLEAKLIKKHQPYYNTREKDDRSFNYVVVTKEDFPRVLVVRGRELVEVWNEDDIKHKFGPFPHGGELREALRIVRKIFPFRDKCLPAVLVNKKGSHNAKQPRPCFNRQIGLCPGVCSGECSRAEYARTIRSIKLFFGGKKGAIIKGLEKHMRAEAKKENFEKAAKLRNKIFALNHINDVAMMKKGEGGSASGFRIEAYDVAHLSGKDTVGAMVAVVGGELAKVEYKKFKLKGAAKDRSDDTANLEEVLRRRFAHPEWGVPDLVVIDGGRAQKARTERVLAEMGVKVTIVSVVKDERHKPRDILSAAEDSKVVRDYRSDILLANGEAHRFALAYHKKLRRLTPGSRD